MRRPFETNYMSIILWSTVLEAKEDRDVYKAEKRKEKINQMLAVAIRYSQIRGHTLKQRGVHNAVGNLMGLWIVRLRWQCGEVNCSKAEAL